VIGGDGIDQVYGGAGRDELWGGLTSNAASNDQGDKFCFTSTGDSDWELTFVNGKLSLVDARDRIMDLGTGDKIDVSVIDANSSAAGNQDFNWQGDDALTGIGQARAFFQNGDTIVQFSTDADAAAEMEIVVKGLHLIDSSDFLGVFA
jgi:Ca2+-binding RTX toxin-like protein